MHLIYKYFSDKKETYNDLKIEVQLRSALQHAWATAVETVGTFIRQALKSSQGEDEWLRFFAVMGSALAIREDTPLVPGTPTDQAELKKELVCLATSLDVENHLRTYGEALQAVENLESNDHYYLLQLNPSAKETTIKGYKQNELEQAQQDYIDVERTIKGGTDAVLVSVESIATLKRAYPNYFLDTHVFLSALEQAISE